MNTAVDTVEAEKVLCYKSEYCRFREICGGAAPHDFDAKECNRCPKDSAARCNPVEVKNV